MARIAFLGDVMLGRLVSDQLRRGRRPESCWGDVAPLLQNCDGVVANLECAITSHDQPWLRAPKMFHFGADPMAVEVLKRGNVRAVSLANNHVLDFEVAGLLDTLENLDRAGIAHAGAGRSEGEAFTPARLRLGDLEVALFAVTDNEPAFAAKGNDPGTAYVDLDVPAPPLPIRAEIAADWRGGADLTILSCHLGPNMVTKPSPEIRDYHRKAAHHGFDIIHGHSAHLTQGVERMGGSLLLHDTGDFIDDYAIDPVLRNDWSFVFMLEADRSGPSRLALIPVILSFAEVHLAKPEEAGALCERMMKQSARFGTAFTRTAEGLELAISA